jgi:ATP-dependent protease HslVU (ClpYQ) peptidase subunit
MKTYSSEQLPTYQVSGQELRIHWDAKEVPVGEATQWEQEEALCNVSDSYGLLVAKIIGSVYDHNAEFAAINDGGEKYATYQAFRTQAKALAQGWIDQE